MRLLGLLPERVVEIATCLSSAVATDRLLASVNVRGIANTFYWPSTARLPFRGRIRGSVFRIAPNSSFSQTVVIDGEIVSSLGGATISATISPASLFTAPWFERLARAAERDLRHVFREGASP